MRSLSKVLLALGVAVLLAGPTFAQGRQNPVKSLLENKDFQKDLSLTEDQVKKAVTAADDIFKKHEDDFKDIDFRSPEGQQKMAAAMKTVSNEMKKALGEILDAKQMKRYNQISLQGSLRRGPNAFADADLQKDLKLTDEQKDKIKTISADLTKEIDDMRKDAGEDQAKRREMFQKMQGLNKEASEKITKLLTTEQKKTLEEMKGEEFKFPERGPRPPQ